MKSAYKRQHAVGILLNWAQLAIRVGKPQLPLIAVLLYKGDEVTYFWGLLFVISLIVLPFTIGVLNYWFNTYAIDTDRQLITVKEGFLGRQIKEMQFNRVQQLRTSQTLVQRLFHTRQLVLESAGGQANDILFQALSDEAVAEIEQFWQDNRTALPTVAIETENEAKQHVENADELASEPLFNVRFSALLRYGLTAYYIQTISVIVAYSLSIGHEILSYFEVELYELNELPAFNFDAFIWIGMLTALLIFALLFNMLRTLFRYWDLRIEIRQFNWHIRYGLWNQQHFIVLPSRVQMVVVQQNPLQKYLGLYKLKVHQAIGTETSNKETQKGVIQFVAITENQLHAVLDKLDITPNQSENVIYPNWRSWGVKAAVVLLVALPLIVGLWWGNALREACTVLSIMVVLLVLIWGNYKRQSLHCSPKGYCLHSGLWEQERIWVNVHRLQRLALQQYRWHRKLGITHFSGTTAAGVVGLSYVSAVEIQPYFVYWLDALSTQNRDWM